MSEAINNSPENYEVKLLDETQVKTSLMKENKITQGDQIKIDHNENEGTINVNINNGKNALILSFDGVVLYDLNEIKSIPNMEEKAKDQGYLVNKLPNGFLKILQIEKHGKPTNLEIGGSEYMTALSAIIFSQSRMNTISKIQSNNGEKIEDKELDELSNQFALKPIDIILLKEKGAIDEQQAKKYLNESIGNMISIMADGRMEKVATTNEDIVKKLNGKEYQIKQSEINVQELDYYKDSGLIDEDEYQIHIEFLKDLNLLKEEEKKQVTNCIDETKKELSNLNSKNIS
ncbi:MAG: hypothetical protein V3575_04240 [Candidatus Absconditabacteria bacterium]